MTIWKNHLLMYLVSNTILCNLATSMAWTQATNFCSVFSWLLVDKYFTTVRTGPARYALYRCYQWFLGPIIGTILYHLFALTALSSYARIIGQNRSKFTKYFMSLLLFNKVLGTCPLIQAYVPAEPETGEESSQPLSAHKQNILLTTTIKTILSIW